MYLKHKKIYYPGGFISLFILPFLFYFSTINDIRTAERIAVIQVDNFQGDFTVPPFYYEFNAFPNSSERQLIDFTHFIDSIRQIKNKRYNGVVVNIPDQTPYGTLIKYMDILSPYNYRIGFGNYKIISARVDNERRAAESDSLINWLRNQYSREKRKSSLIEHIQKDITIIAATSDKIRMYAAILIS